MSYLYNKVKEAIGGVNTKTNHTSLKNWSPNNIRAVYIMRDFVIVAYYTNQPRLTVLDQNEVGLDLQNPNRIGSLNNLLANRQLSCMEEIYVDSVFQMYPAVMNLEAYVQSLVSQSSRLRYYGYVEAFDANSLMNLYSNALINGAYDCTAAGTIGTFRFTDLKNDTWYMKHNLRPMYYALDADKGQLAIYFNKCQKQISEKYDAIRKESEFYQKAGKLAELMMLDSIQIKYYVQLFGFIKRAHEIDSSNKTIETLMRVAQSSFRFSKINGLSLEYLKGTFSKLNLPEKERKDLINTVNVYNRLGLLSESGSFNIDEYMKGEGKKLKSNGGFLQIFDRVDELALNFYKVLPTTGKNIMLVSVFEHKDNLPSCRFVESIKIPPRTELNESSVETLIDIIAGACGWSIGFYKSVA